MAFEGRFSPAWPPNPRGTTKRAPERPGAGVIIQTVPRNGLPSAGPIREQQSPYRSPPRVQIRTRLNGNMIVSCWRTTPTGRDARTAQMVELGLEFQTKGR